MQDTFTILQQYAQLYIHNRVESRPIPRAIAEHAAAKEKRETEREREEKMCVFFVVFLLPFIAQERPARTKESNAQKRSGQHSHAPRCRESEND